MQRQSTLNKQNWSSGQPGHCTDSNKKLQKQTNPRHNKSLEQLNVSRTICKNVARSCGAKHKNKNKLKCPEMILIGRRLADDKHMVFPFCLSLANTLKITTWTKTRHWSCATQLYLTGLYFNVNVSHFQIMSYTWANLQLFLRLTCVDVIDEIQSWMVEANASHLFSYYVFSSFSQTLSLSGLT